MPTFCCALETESLWTEKLSIWLDFSLETKLVGFKSLLGFLSSVNFDILKLLKSVGAQLLSAYSRRLFISQWSANSFQTNNVQLHSVCEYYGNSPRNASVNVVGSGNWGDVGNLPRRLAVQTFDYAGINIKDWVFDQGQQSNSAIIRWSVIVFHFAVVQSLSKFMFFVCFRLILVLFRIYNWPRTLYESRNDLFQ